MALKNDVVAEKSKDRLSRDFWGRSIFDFCNNILLKADVGGRTCHVGLTTSAEQVGRSPAISGR